MIYSPFGVRVRAAYDTALRVVVARARKVNLPDRTLRAQIDKHKARASGGRMMTADSKNQWKEAREAKMLLLT